MLLVFTLVFTSVTPCFADATVKSYDPDYEKYQRALANVENGKYTPKEKVILCNLITEKYNYIVAKKKGMPVEMPYKNFTKIGVASSEPFRCIAVYEVDVDEIKRQASKLFAYGALTDLSTLPALFAGKVTLLAKTIAATGAIFNFSGALIYLSYEDLQEGSIYTGENWFRWRDEDSYIYEVYTKTYVTYDGEIISQVVKSPVHEGDFDS
jgi:hypothetical protein